VRRSPSSEVEAEPEPWGRARQRPSSKVDSESEPWDRARRSLSSEVEVESEPWGRARWSSSSEVESEPWCQRGGASYGARGWTWLLTTSPWRVAQQSEQGRRRCFLVRSVSRGAK
jgi:hypothetical protein